MSLSSADAANARTYETDRDLIHACRLGDAQAWNELLDRYERLVYSIPLNYSLPLADAADIVQLTFTILLQSLDTLDDDSNLGAWLATVARRHTWRLLAQSKREQVNAGGDLSERLFSIPDEHGGQELERAELIQWLNQGLNALDDRCRRLLVALYFATDKPSYAAVAEQMGMAEGSIGPTRARCLERLKSLLEEMR